MPIRSSGQQTFVKYAEGGRTFYWLLNIPELVANWPNLSQRERRKLKFRLMEYYEGETCVCGNIKRRGLWDCEGCAVKRGREFEEVEINCDAHTLSVLKYLDTL